MGAACAPCRPEDRVDESEEDSSWGSGGEEYPRSPNSRASSPRSAKAAKAPANAPVVVSSRPFHASGGDDDVDLEVEEETFALPALKLLAAAQAHPPPMPGRLPTVGLRQQAPPREQESDAMERLARGPNCCDEVTNAVRLVSLGCYCGPKLSFQKMGRGAETLPFDWMRTRLDGLLHFLRNDFDGFFDFVTRLPVPGSPSMTMFRGPLHSFWHDDPTDPSMQERYTRRIARLEEMSSSPQQALFVRVAAVTDELLRADELLLELQGRFGAQARLLLLLNFQERTSGPAIFPELPGLMVYYVPSQVHQRSSDSFGQPYVAPVRCALDWAVGRGVQALSLPGLEAASQLATQSDWGARGLGGLAAFEELVPVVAPAAASSAAAPL